MKSVKSKNKVVEKSRTNFESFQPKKKMEVDKKPKVSVKSRKFWDDIDDDSPAYRIKGM